MSGCGVEQVAMHRPLQHDVPVPHVTLPHRHLPALQWPPPVQAVPHPPQLASSDCVFLQPAVPQHVLPVAHAFPFGAQPH